MLSERMKALLFRCLQTPSFAANTFYLRTMQAVLLRARMVKASLSTPLAGGSAFPFFFRTHVGHATSSVTTRAPANVR